MSEGIRPVSFEDAPVSLMAGAGYSAQNWKFELAVSVEVSPRPSDFIFLVEDSSPDDGDGVR